MARLAHPNVVTVYEVGSADGRDYIAMELIDGENLVEWQRTTKPDRRAVLQAFVAAGHGLATAHEAEIVHRDFKPQNVLRSRRGRVMVTDFGLAHETAHGEPDSHDRPSRLSALTISGFLMGTPAYMAPEQWTGDQVTPATDQFAFCIALWEGLAGARPFTGEAAEELREQVLRGPDALDASPIPRRLRAALLRGLSVDPAKRWPTMHALLAQIGRDPRRVVAGIALLGVVVAAIAFVAFGRTSRTAAATCEPPRVAPSSVWGPLQDGVIRAGSVAAADQLGAAFAHWQDVRADVCAQASPNRSGRLACLDKVLSRIDAVRRARLLNLQMGMWGVVSQLYEPAVCLRDDPPRMPEHYSDNAVLGLAQRGGAHLYQAADKARTEVDNDACARAYLGIMDSGLHGAEQSKNAAQLCGDDQAYAAATINVIRRHAKLFPDPELPQALREAQRAVEHAAQPFLTREYLFTRAVLAFSQDDLDAAIDFADRAAGGPPVEFEEQRLLFAAAVRIARGRPSDLETVRRDVAHLRTQPSSAAGRAEVLDGTDATCRWFQGDVRSAHPALVTADTRLLAQWQPDGGSVHGVVVDVHGAPVPDATVVVGTELVGDAVGVAVPLFDPGSSSPPLMQRTITDSRGGFSFAHAPPGAVAIAQHGGDRSAPASVSAVSRLVVMPTAVVRGTVDAAPGDGQLTVSAAVTSDYQIVAPVLGDGSFELGGLPIGSVSLQVVRTAQKRKSTGISRTVHTGTTALADIALVAPVDRTLAVIVRSATGMAIDGAAVVVAEGAIHPDTLATLDQVTTSKAFATAVARVLIDPPAAELAPLIRRGDVVAQLRGVPAGPVSVCASGLQVDITDPSFAARYAASQGAQPVRCVSIDAAATHAVVEVPPMKRLE